jgi:hypothetical protein
MELEAGQRVSLEPRVWQLSPRDSQACQQQAQQASLPESRAHW